MTENKPQPKKNNADSSELERLKLKRDDYSNCYAGLFKQFTLAMEINVELREALEIALKELSDVASFMYVHNATPKHWPIEKLVKATENLKKTIDVSGLDTPLTKELAELKAKNNADSELVKNSSLDEFKEIRDYLSLVIQNVEYDEPGRYNYLLNSVFTARNKLEAALSTPISSVGSEKMVENWQDISTAPKERKIIVGYKNECDKWRSVMACFYPENTLPDSNDCGEYADEGWYEESEAYREDLLPLEREPTHWQPLLNPPISSEKGEG